LAARTSPDLACPSKRSTREARPQRSPSSADDAGSILLDPSKTFEDFGKVHFTPIEETVKSAIEYFNEFGVHGEYTHLKIEKK
jgi:hypothetical protein